MFRALHTPALGILIDDLFTRDPQKISAHLGVSLKTLARWRAADEAPRAVLLALFYETRWGYSLLYSEAFNRETLSRQLADSLRRENAALLVRIARLEATGNFGSANSPLLRAPLAGPAPTPPSLAASARRADTRPR